MNYTDSPLLFSIAVGLAALVIMYLFRIQAQRLIEQFFRVLQKQFRLLSKICIRSEQRVRLRHYEVTKALVEVLSQRRVQRRYGDIEARVAKELAYYKGKSKVVSQHLQTLQKDYEDSAHIPPPSPDWVAAVESIAQIEGDERNSEVMAKILADMHNTVQLHQQDAMREHRWSVSNRHKLLAELEPQWRRLGQLLAATENKSATLQRDIRRLDQEMCRYELLTAGNGQGFMASVLARFFLASLLMFIAALVGFYNSQLLLLPFAQQLGSSLSLSLPVLTMHSAMLILAAVLLCETTGATHMLPLLAPLRRWLKNSLAAMAGLMILALSLLSASWAGGMETMAGVMQADLQQWSLAIMSFFACWLFAAVVIPLEYAVQTFRPVLSSSLQLLLYCASVLFRVLASLSVELGRLVMRLYDAVIFIPLQLDAKISARLQQSKPGDKAALGSAISGLEPTSMTFNEEQVDCGNVTQIDFAGYAKKGEGQ
ncbi:hypothetical protein NO559_01175 [Dasania sp. GY-MA-18]|uniref:Uncharacterized protein n=1 Tax=Dasania phycosphaerae TaxID=2950436 RepID=A0A9J6RGL4_9GAMM|nr:MULTISPECIES: hypothetical protein [Dasania]MCR8921362.1 hypothetical protein [Dasania sp. GY-MA-18]MCZ0863790.1 hypothetical protein [Dasania phycosphaerae]MCZ0867518.1 hypothetical protein [Dasania phycosphaerae]